MCARKKCNPCSAPLGCLNPPPLCPPCPPICDVVNHGFSGNILLNDSVTTLEIWKEEMIRKATVTIAVSNISINSPFIKVTITRNVGSPVEFTVPLGNTLSATVDNAKSITVSREGVGIVEGKYCLEVSFVVSS